MPLARVSCLQLFLCSHTLLASTPSPPGFTEGKIKHVPSNQDLLRNMSAAVGVRVRYARSQSTNSLSTLPHLRTRNTSLGDLQSVLESPAAPQLRPQLQAAVGASQAAGAAVAGAEQQHHQQHAPAVVQQAAVAMAVEAAAAAAGEAAAAAGGLLGSTAASPGAAAEPGAAAGEVDLALEVPLASTSAASSPGQEAAAISITAESSAVVVPAGGVSAGSSGSSGSSFSEVEAAASSDAGHELVSM